MNTNTRPGHLGRNISRIRELRNMKQEALAIALNVSQQTISNMENSENLDDNKLKDIALALGVTPEAIKNFSEEAVFSIIGNTYNFDNASILNTNLACTFNPLDKLLEAHEEMKTLHEEMKELYERMLASEREKNELLVRMLGK